MQDFESEVSMYLNIKKANLNHSQLKKSGSICQDLISSYEILNKINIVENKEVSSCVSWVKDLKNLGI